MPKRLPRNAAPIPFPASGQSRTFLSTSPTSFTSDQYPSLGQWSDQVDIPTRSPSSYSEIEVVLDDGTLQKRTVSLSTVPEPLSPTHDDFNTHDDSADEMVSQYQSTSFKNSKDKSRYTKHIHPCASTYLIYLLVRQRHCCKAAVLVKQPTMLFQNQAHQPPRAIPTRHFSLLHPKRAISINTITTVLYLISHLFGQEQERALLIGNSPLHSDKC